MALAEPFLPEQSDATAQQRLPMVISSSPQPAPSEGLQRFLRVQIGLSDSALALGLKQAQLEQAPLAVVLWRFGLISLEQLDLVLSWQDQNL
jgi:hypothetical protein